MEILNLQQIIWQAVNFLVLYFVIAKFVVPPTKKFMAQREKEIHDGLANAEKVKKQLAESRKEQEEILAAARAEGKTLIDEMRVKADELSKKMMEEARVQAQDEVSRIVAKAEADLDKKRSEMDTHVIHLAKAVAEKALADSITTEMHHEILKKQLEQVKTARIQG
jgi:F-type H+-transporting ATPase subunit b